MYFHFVSKFIVAFGSNWCKKFLSHRWSVCLCIRVCSGMCVCMLVLELSFITIKGCSYPGSQALGEQRPEKVSFVALCSRDIFISCTNQQWRVKSSWVTISDLSLEGIIVQWGRLMSWLVFPQKLSSSSWAPFWQHCWILSNTCFRQFRYRVFPWQNMLWLLQNECWELNLTYLWVVIIPIILKTFYFCQVLSTFCFCQFLWL